MAMLGTNNSTAPVVFTNPTADGSANYTPTNPAQVTVGTSQPLGGTSTGATGIGAVPPRANLDSRIVRV